MRLTAIKLTNYRAYQVETTIEIDPLTMIIGRNDSGKSSVLEALDVYFNEASIDTDDLSKRGQTNEIKISCVFDDLPESLVVDDQHPTTLQEEYLLRADGQLEIRKTYICPSNGKGRIKSIAAIANHPTADGIDDLLSLKITDLRQKCVSRTVDMAGKNQTIKSDLRAALWAQAADLALAERPVELMKEDAKNLVDQIQLHFPVYALFKSDRASTDQDAEAQDPMKIAIKEVIKSKEEDLQKIVVDVEKQLRSVADKTVEKIAEMNPDLARELIPTTKNQELGFTLLSFIDCRRCYSTK
jgi:putative ATP-dependent endonuclease of the OLD family